MNGYLLESTNVDGTVSTYIPATSVESATESTSQKLGNASVETEIVAVPSVEPKLNKGLKY